MKMLDKFLKFAKEQNIVFSQQGNVFTFTDGKSLIKAIQLLADLGYTFSQKGFVVTVMSQR